MMETRIVDNDETNFVKEAPELYRRVLTTDIVVENETIWLSLAVKNGLVEVNMNTWETKILCRFPEKNSYNLYNSIVKIDNKLLLAPCTAENIAIYDLETGELRCLALEKVFDNRKEIYDANSKFYKIYVDGESAFLLGYYYPAIVRVNMSTYEIQYITDWVFQIERLIDKGDKRGYIGAGYVQKDRKVYFPIQCYPALLELDLATLKTKVEVISCPLDGIGTMAEQGKYIWLEGKGNAFGKIGRLSIESNVFEEIDLDEKLERKDDCVPFFEPIWIGNSIFLFPLIASAIYEIDTVSLKGKKMELNNQLRKTGEGLLSVTVYMTKYIDDNIYFLTGHDLMWHIYNVKTKELASRYIYLPQKYAEQEMRNDLSYHFEKGDIIEEKDISLECLLHHIDNDVVQIKQEKNIGKLVYAVLR